MIKKPTVLILGAGASIDYGFPLGRILITNLCGSLKSERDPYVKFLVSCGFDFGLITAFRESLEFSGQPSIDAFLENRVEFLDVGKAAIACDLIPAESEARFGRDAKNYRWYEYLFARMNATPEQFPKNKLGVITFNYDRSLEHFLFLSLKHSYQLTDNDSADLLRYIPVIHVYGKLGDLPYLNTNGTGRPYDPTLNAQTIKQCVQSMKIMYEKADKEPDKREIIELLTNAEAICFLGFGYHPANIDKLHLSSITDIEKKTILGSAYGLTSGEMEQIRKLLPDHITFGRSPEEDVLGFLRHSAILGW